MCVECVTSQCECSYIYSYRASILQCILILYACFTLNIIPVDKHDAQFQFSVFAYFSQQGKQFEANFPNN